MGMHVNYYGDPGKPALMLIHGWGMNSQIWGPMADSLSQDFYLICPDIPGLGRSSLPADFSLQNLSTEMAEELAKLSSPAILFGWSLGGVVAAAIASQFPERVKALVTLATNPCFVSREDWPWGMDQLTYQQFEQSLSIRPGKTLQRFCGLMAQGENDPRSLVRELTDLIGFDQLPSGLEQTLALLREDYRPLFASLSLPREYWFAEADALVNSECATAPLLGAYSSNLPGSHLLLLTEPQLCAERIRQFAGTLKQPESVDG